MRIDESALQILERKRARLAAMGARSAWYEELTPLLRWVLSVPTLHAYVKQVLRMHDHEEREVARTVDRALVSLPPLAKQWREATASIDPDNERWPGSQQWSTFERSLAEAGETKALDTRRERAKAMAFVIRTRADNAWKKAVDADAHEPLTDVYDQIAKAADEVTFAVESWENTQATSPRTAFVNLIDLCRAVHPPPDHIDHWTDFLPRDRFKPIIDHDKLKENYANMHADAATALARFVEEMQVVGASTLSRRVIVERFKERCTWYDKPRLREIAGSGAGREDRLTLELAKYLHDAGLFVLVRPRVSNLEPDVVGIQGIAVEAKAYADSGTARADIVHGFYQLHAYMTSLETEALRVTEGYVVAFRLGGPIYETPPTIDTGRFLIHSLTIDLGESDESGRKQPPTLSITEEEIFKVLNEGEPQGTRTDQSA